MKRLTVTFLLFAYLVGSFYTVFVEGGTAERIDLYDNGISAVRDLPDDNLLLQDPTLRVGYWWEQIGEKPEIGYGVNVKEEEEKSWWDKLKDLLGINSNNQQLKEQEQKTKHDGGKDMVAAFWGFMDGISTIMKAVTLAAKPLTWDFPEPMDFLELIFKSIWAILLAVSYIDISQDIINVLHKVFEGVGSLIPFT